MFRRLLEEDDMPSPYDEEIEALLAQYREQRDGVQETRRKINEISATAASPRQSVKVTVGAQGQLTALEFPTGAYRNMAPTELAKTILAAVTEARAKAFAKVNELAFSGLADAVPAELLQGGGDPRALLPEELGMPDIVRAYVDRGDGVEGGTHG
jgi:DNA-binding protein YbaB